MISVDYLNSQFTYTFNGYNTIIDFSDVTSSYSWTTLGIITITLISGEITSLNRNGFIDTIKATNRDSSGNIDAYDENKTLYKLYRVLDGLSESEADAEIANLEAIRDSVDGDLTSNKATNDTAISDWGSQVDANSSRAVAGVAIASLTATIDTKNTIVTYFTDNHTLLPNVWDYADTTITTIKETYYDPLIEDIIQVQIEKDGVSKYYDQMQGFDPNFFPLNNSTIITAASDFNTALSNIKLLTAQIDNLNPDDPNYSSDEATLNASLTTNRSNLSSAKSILDNELDGLLTDKRDSLFSIASQIIAQVNLQITSDQSSLASMTTAFEAMPNYNPDPVPTKILFDDIRGLDMKKMFYIVNDGRLGKTLTTIARSDIAVYEGLYGEISI